MARTSNEIIAEALSVKANVARWIDRLQSEIEPRSDKAAIEPITPGEAAYANEVSDDAEFAERVEEFNSYLRLNFRRGDKLSIHGDMLGKNLSVCKRVVKAFTAKGWTVVAIGVDRYEISD